MKEKRIVEILGWLSAYRNGWISYDREHVLTLQTELIELSK